MGRDDNADTTGLATGRSLGRGLVACPAVRGLPCCCERGSSPGAGTVRVERPVSAALLHDLAHLEVGLRNAYDVVLSTRWPGPPHWTLAGYAVFAPLYRRRGRRRVDVNDRPRESLRHAIANAGGPTAPPGKVVAELMFGFWRYLSSAAHEKTLWVPALHRAFPPGTDRAARVDGPVGRLHDLRNRVAHHEPLLNTDVAGRLSDLTGVAARLDPHLGQHVQATSTVSSLLATRP